jgi:hypothetical protein
MGSSGVGSRSYCQADSNRLAGQPGRLDAGLRTGGGRAGHRASEQQGGRSGQRDRNDFEVSDTVRSGKGRIIHRGKLLLKNGVLLSVVSETGDWVQAAGRAADALCVILPG